MRLYRHQLRWEQLLFWRSRESAVFVFLFPLLLFTLLTAVYNGRIYGRPASWALLAGMLGYGAATTAFAGLALILVARRELGILKRIRSTPLPPATYLVAVLTSIMLVFALQAVSLFVLGKVLKSTPWPSQLTSLTMSPLRVVRLTWLPRISPARALRMLSVAIRLKRSLASTRPP